METRKNGLVCMTCVYFEGVEDIQGFVKIGICKRYAPTFRGFPHMQPHNCCGEHRIDENKIDFEEIEEKAEVDFEYNDEDEYVEPEPYTKKGMLPQLSYDILDKMFEKNKEKEFEKNKEKEHE